MSVSTSDAPSGAPDSDTQELSFRSDAPRAKGLRGAATGEAVSADGEWRDPLVEGEEPSDINNQALYEHMRTFFEPPSLDASGDFVAVSQPVRWEGGGCGQEGPSTGRFSDLGEFARGLGANLKRYPPDLPFSNLNEFFKRPDGSAFVQLSIVPFQQAPQRGFAVEMFLSDSHTLQNIKESGVLAPDDGQGALGRSEALEALARAA